METQDNTVNFKIEMEQKKPFWFLTDRRVRNITFIVLVFILLIAGPLIMTPDKSSLYLSGIFFIGLIIALFLFFAYRKPSKKFSINNNGILVQNRLYQWNEIQNFHWLGESQSERFGITSVRNFDPVNPYAGTATQIAKIFLKKNRFNLFADYFGFLDLEVSRERMNEFVEMLQKYGIEKISFKKQAIGSWRSAVLLLLLFSLIFVIIFVAVLFIPPSS